MAHDLHVRGSCAIHVEVFNVYLQVASINRIPKPKIQKSTKNETESNEQNTDSSTSTDSSSQSDQSESQSEETVDEQPKSHDEL